MSLVSKLLKRYLISSLTNTPWELSTPTRNADTKPNFVLPDGTEPLIFNVTHQAGIVGVCAALNPPQGLQIGMDIVYPAERRAHDIEIMSNSGLRGFMEIYQSVLCAKELDALCAMGLADPDEKLRYFYTLWCLREAYVKMTGEALLASWLGDLEMRHYAPPEVVADEGDKLEVWFGGNMVRNVRKWLVNYDQRFVICTFLRDGEESGELDFGEFTSVSMHDLVSSGEYVKERNK